MMECQPSAKRPRPIEDQGLDIEEIVHGISHAVTTRQRFEILSKLFEAIRYDSRSRTPNVESATLSYCIDLGVIRSLCLQLGFVLRRHGSVKEEIQETCTALAVFYRYCPELVASEDALRTKGADLFFLLPEAFQKGACLPVLSIWHTISSSKVGTAMLLQSPSALLASRDVIQGGISGKEGLMETLGLLKNMTYYGEEHRHLFVDQPGLLSALTSIPLNENCERARERISAVYRNMALSLSNRSVLGARADFLTAIATLGSSSSLVVLRNMLSTLVNLAMDANSSLLMVFHGEGIIIEILRRFVAYKEDATLRKRAVRVLRLLARETSAPLMVHDNRLMKVLSERALHDTNTEVRAEAAEAFAKCASLVKAPMAQHEAMLDALTHLSTGHQSISADVMARALKEQASQPENRKALIKRSALVTALGQIAMSGESSLSAKENVCSAFFDLSSDDENVRSLLATTLTLEALVHNSGDNGAAYSAIRRCSVETLLNLAVVPSNRKSMAQHTSLLQSLLHFAAATQVGDLKAKVKSTILQLAAEL
eukprot:scaffold15973_cov120-Cylindrotheca_fusiformis.AAC.9